MTGICHIYYSILVLKKEVNFMLLNIQHTLKSFTTTIEEIHLSDVTVNTDSIYAIMINEVVPKDSSQDFYGTADSPQYLKTTIPLFQKAGIQINSIQELLSRGIYITNAVKIPKDNYTIEKEIITKSAFLLEKEIDLFPNLKVIMLMGDVAKKTFNSISKKATGKNVIPSISTYKLKNSTFYYKSVQVIPSYIITGNNILIEKSKFEMVSEDIRKMMKLLN